MRLFLAIKHRDKNKMMCEKNIYAKMYQFSLS